MSVDAVPGSEPFTSVAAFGRSPQLCVCVWLFVCLFVCSVAQPPVTRSDFTWRCVSLMVELTQVLTGSVLFLTAEGQRLFSLIPKH